MLVLSLCVPAQLSVHCACRALGDIGPLWPAAVLNILLLGFTVFFKYSYLELQTFFTQNLWFVFLIFSYVLPVSAHLLRKQERGRQGKTGEQKHGAQCGNRGARMKETRKGDTTGEERHE